MGSPTYAQHVREVKEGKDFVGQDEGKKGKKKGNVTLKWSNQLISTKG